MSCRTLLVMAGVVSLAACADNPAAPRDDTSREIAPTAGRDAGVAVLGTLTRRTESGLVLMQQGFEFEGAADPRVRSARYEPSIGRIGDDLAIVVDGSTEIYLNGRRASSLGGVPLGTKLVVAGPTRDGSIKAAVISDLASTRSSTVAATVPPPSRGELEAASAVDAPIEPAQVVSLCIGQNMDYTHPRIHEFHGCYGGPSVSDRIAVPDIPIGCGVIGCWFVDEVSYTVALGGWIFDWPFRFGASTPGLTYHIPGPVAFSLTALSALGTAFTFTGGLGVDVGVDLELCNPFGCFDAGTQHLNILTTAHQTTGAGPLRPDQELQIGEVACPSIGIIPVDLPVDPVSLGICEDLALLGEPFQAVVQAHGASGQIGGIGSIFDFEGPDDTRTIRPDSTFVVVTYREFSWTPTLTVGIYFKIDLVGGINLWTSPTIPISTGPFAPVSTPYPNEFGFTLATDPENLAAFLHQPTLDTVAVFEVAPAPTTLTVISPPVLEQGMPVQVRLTESFDGSRIADAEIRFTATSSGGAVLVAFDTTDGSGIAETILPNGEHDVLVEYAGSPVYLPSSATQHVFVYLPTTFVIWGGNAGGVAVGGRYNFWGSQWHKQVTGGDFTANASFKGYAHTVIDDAWIAGGGNSTRPPDELGELIGVIVSTVITRHEEVTTGNVTGRVLLRVENLQSYGPSPGHSGFGIMLGVIPPSPSEQLQAASRAMR